DQPDIGTVTINGRDVTRVPPQHRVIGFVFQHYAAFKHLTVRDNVAYGLKIRKRPRGEIREKVDHLLEVVGLSGFHHRYPNQLSGVSVNGWHWPGRWRSIRKCCCSTSRSARWTRR